ncbi:hypothetical protein MAPG_10926 [Magnaporthiopsis poae ATCC 64411]|uniref:Heterokaryon incompatibility domain-containing protein n=1 Tax=Magnaporthiopsis poae (strain ATCC 64411 / 73-15) TaxID=644358 RepID=A0A0C4EDW6_MAGP6|nr:hypothetical protein MAPG_10926 [Magnaporthiopsis poae ATCC 64411]
MKRADYTLTFLENLGGSFSDQDVEEIWNDHVFPLVHTDDFGRNWQQVSDPNGRFFLPSGDRCRVDAQPHHLKRCIVNLQDGNIQTPITYESIVFSKVAYHLHLKKASKQAQRPSVVDHRVFMDQFAKKLPFQWRELIVHHHIHLYEDSCRPPVPLSVDVGTHQPLGHPKNIRLLKLLPAQDSWAQLECTLFETTLSPDLGFEALSYVWGDQSPHTLKPLALNGLAFSVGKNLDAALRQLRPRTGSPRIMWIDAVCIDQTNDQEKAEQVAQMDDIYRNAASVVVWVGRESQAASFLFKTIAALDEFMTQKDLVGNFSELQHSFFPFRPMEYSPKHLAEQHRHRHTHDQDGPPNTWKILKSMTEGWKPMKNPELQAAATRFLAQNPHMAMEVWIKWSEGYIKILSRPWWQRVWVLQELLLANKAILHCGPHSVDWKLFRIHLFKIVTLLKHIVFCASRYPNARITRLTGLFYTLVQETRKAFPFLLMRGETLPTDRVTAVTMEDLVSLTSSFAATNPCDKLFALVSLLPTGSLERLVFAPNYSTKFTRVYIKAATHWLKTTRRLDVIVAWAAADSGLSLGTEHNETGPHLPSWVPDFRRRQLFEYSSIWINSFSPHKILKMYMRHILGGPPIPEAASTEPTGDDYTSHQIQVYDASLYPKSPFPLDFAAWDEILLPRGVTVDKRSDKEVTAAQLSLFKHWKSLAGVGDQGPYPCTGQTRLEAFWRTLWLDRFRVDGGQEGTICFSRIPHDTQFFDSNTFENEEIVSEVLTSLLGETIEAYQFANANPYSLGMRFFRTRQGYIGIGHPNVREGDKIVVLLGAPVPLILREFPEGHMVVGQSYVHGIMDGEIIKAKVGEGEPKEEDFEQFRVI